MGMRVAWSPPNKGVGVGWIVGGVLGAVLSCVLAVGAFIVFLRRRNAGAPYAEAVNRAAKDEELLSTTVHDKCFEFIKNAQSAALHNGLSHGPCIL